MEELEASGNVGRGEFLQYVDIQINNHEVKNLRMKLSEGGIAYFVEVGGGIR